MAKQRDDAIAEQAVRQPEHIEVTVYRRGGAKVTYEVVHWSVNEHGMLTLVRSDSDDTEVHQTIYPPNGYDRADVDLTYPEEF